MATDGKENCGRRVLIHEGGVFNARVYRVEEAGGGVHIEKDFSQNPWIVRNTLGRFLISRECWILRRLEPTGIVPTNVRRISAFALREDFCHGFTLRDSCCGVHSENTVPTPEKAGGVPLEMMARPIPPEFFEALEKGIRSVHAKGFVHLDLHNERNVIVGPGYKPTIIDWQSALPTFRLPFFRRFFERIDLAGVYKFRERFRPGELGAKERGRLARMSFIRRHFWVPRIMIGKRGPGEIRGTEPAIHDIRPGNTQDGARDSGH